MIDWEQIGGYIRAARRAHRPKVTQTELADRLGLGQQAISKIENGAVTTLETLDAICKELGVDMNLTFDVPNLAISRYEGPPEIVRVAAALGQIPPDERRVLVRVLETFSEWPEDLRSGALLNLEFYADRYSKGKSTRSAIV